MRSLFPRLGLLVLGFFLTASLQAGLVHRYRFNESSGSTTRDWVGTANGTLQGDATFSGDGRLILSGGGYVALPSGMIASLTNVTFEFWCEWTGGEAWEPVFDFGGGVAAAGSGPDAGYSSILFTPYTTSTGVDENQQTIDVPGPAVFGSRETAAGSALFPATQIFVEAPVPETGSEVHWVLVYDFLNRKSRIYRQGRLISTGFANFPLRNLADMNNWIGKRNESDLAIQSGFQGSINEFRIYDHPLTDWEASENDSMGPDRILADGGTLQSIEFAGSTEYFVGKSENPKIIAHFANIANADLSGDPAVTFSSSDPAVLSTPGNAVVTPLKAGTVTLTAAYGGKTATASITVGPLPVRHRYSFNEGVGSGAAKDLVGTADGTLVAGAAFDGTGKVFFNGTDGYVVLPQNVLSGLKGTTFELWVTWAAATGAPDSLFAEEHIFDFGTNYDGGGFDVPVSWLALTPSSRVWFNPFISTNGMTFNTTLNYDNPFAYGIGGNNRQVVSAPALPTATEVHLAITYDEVLRRMIIFQNGNPIATNAVTYPLAAIPIANAFLGKSNGNPDPVANDLFFNGSLNEFRIYEGPMNAAEVLASFQAGPDDKGALRSIRIELDPTMLKDSSQQIKVFATYTKIANVEVTTDPGLSLNSSRTDVVRLNPGGSADALSTGVSTITAQFGGKSASVPVTVFIETTPVLKHRYSFNDAPGSRTIADLVGGANGSLAGSATAATLDGQGLVLTGEDGYVDLPNGTISRLTNATFEVWMTWNGDAGRGSNQKVFDFGNNDAGENQSGKGISYVSLITNYKGVPRFAASTNGPLSELTVLDGGYFSPGVETFVAVTYDFYHDTATYYFNGDPVKTDVVQFPLTALQDVNNWIGRSNFPEPHLNARLNELRIYEGALTAEAIKQHFTLGADALNGSGNIRISSIQKVNGKVRLTVETDQPSAAHRVQESIRLPVWGSDVSNVNAQSSGANQLILEFDPPAGNRFYRIVR